MRTIALLSVLLALPAIAQDPAEKHTLPADTPAAADGSVYDLDSKWSDQEGKTGGLGHHLNDKVRVVVMGYSTCKFACPRLIADLISIESEVKKTPGADKIGYAFISIDPENDTTAQMKKLEGQYSFTPGAWKLLTGTEDGALELAVALGMKYRKTTTDDFAHSNIITVLRKDGSIAHQQIGLGTDPKATLTAIQNATK